MHVCAQVLHTASPMGKATLTHRAWLAYNQGLLPLMPAQAPAVGVWPPQAPAAGARSCLMD